MKILGPMLPLTSPDGKAIIVQRVTESIEPGQLLAVVLSNQDRPHLVSLDDTEIGIGLEPIIEPEEVFRIPKEAGIRCVPAPDYWETDR